MKAVDIDTMSWEGNAADRTKCRSALKQHITTGEEKFMASAADKRASRKEGTISIRPGTTHRCDVCNKDYHSHKVPSRLVLIRLIGVFNHNFAHGIATSAKM